VTYSPHEGTPEELAVLLAAERRGVPYLTWRDGERVQQLLFLERDRITVGRDEHSDLSLSWDPEASRLHALLERLGETWTIVDDGMSRNGTLVNGLRVQGRRRLNDRDVIRCGSSDLLYRDPANATEATVPASAVEAATALPITAAQRRVLVVLCGPLINAEDRGTPPSNPEIAGVLGVSVEAIRTHMKRLFSLFEIPDLPQNRKRAELARRALASGVVTRRDVSG
jgi:FHA domain